MDSDRAFQPSVVNVAVGEDSAYLAMGLTGFLGGGRGDVLGASLWSNDNPGLVTPLLSDGLLTLHFAEDRSGRALIVISAFDDLGASLTIPFSVAVGSVNDPPIVARPMGQLRVEMNAADMALDLMSVFHDVDMATDGDRLSFTATNDNPSLVAVVLKDRYMVLWLQPDSHGVANITVTATDQLGISAQDRLTLIVGDDDQAQAVQDSVETDQVQEAGEEAPVGEVDEDAAAPPSPPLEESGDGSVQSQQQGAASTDKPAVEESGDGSVQSQQQGAVSPDKPAVEESGDNSVQPQQQGAASLDKPAREPEPFRILETVLRPLPPSGETPTLAYAIPPEPQVAIVSSDSLAADREPEVVVAPRVQTNPDAATLPIEPPSIRMISSSGPQPSVDVMLAVAFVLGATVVGVLLLGVRRFSGARR